MCFQIDRVGDDSEPDSFKLRETTNESHDQFSRSVVGDRKARRVVSRSCPDRTGFSFPCVERVAVSMRPCDVYAADPLPSSAHWILPAYHSGRVIARSASPRRCTGKFRALARATSGSLTTRIPKAFELSGRESESPKSRPIRVGSRSFNSGAFGRVGTGLFLMIEPTADQKQSEKGHGNSEETEALSLCKTFNCLSRVKAALVGNLEETDL